MIPVVTKRSRGFLAAQKCCWSSPAKTSTLLCNVTTLVSYRAGRKHAIFMPHISVGHLEKRSFADNRVFRCFSCVEIHQHKGYLKFQLMQNLKTFLLKSRGSPGKPAILLQHLKLPNHQTLKIHIICKSLSKDYSALVQQLLLNKYWVLCLNALIRYLNNLCLTLTPDALG